MVIPPGFTDEMQPLDRFVFGVMKAQSRRMYRSYAAGLEPVNKAIAAAFVIRAWEAVSTPVLDEACAPSEEVEEEQESIDAFRLICLVGSDLFFG
jgi:hypothetical protein